MDFGQPPNERENTTDGSGLEMLMPDETLISSPSIELQRPDSRPKDLWSRCKRLVVHYILQLDGSPHSIALGVFLGFLLGMTPTIGLQMVSYFGLAALTGANRVSGLLPIWISNPFTAVPLYYFNWRVGVFVMTGQLDGSGRSQNELAAVLADAPGQDMPFWERITSAEFWNLLFDLFVTLGVELWVGCIVVGVLTGILGYWATYRGVNAYRRHLAATKG